jgi:hypothetical protein
VADALARGLKRPREQLEGPLTAPCAGSGRC